jgi:hypothetical protein
MVRAAMVILVVLWWGLSDPALALQCDGKVVAITTRTDGSTWTRRFTPTKAYVRITLAPAASFTSSRRKTINPPTPRQMAMAANE